ncbi:hypothetical protein MMG00_12790 [Ignatzschineria rhizosphaerae]|uniref:Uncharacterized protein n=1 Tax=Ignatzschineria rhizosphaerae TaxID=2923279 RepID=A0ABY3WZK5_9GAMM|nr:hypothetical protein [Ignatzschineria rhizosphaerae]UNM96058.1 hypothetical protein MMG00_12790 [Ignatzschineria rhizosphaerae]
MDLYDSGEIDRNSLFYTFLDVQKQLKKEEYLKEIAIRQHAEKMERRRKLYSIGWLLLIFFICCFILINVKSIPATNEAEALANILFIPVIFFSGFWVYRDTMKGIKKRLKVEHQCFIDKTKLS